MDEKLREERERDLVTQKVTGREKVKITQEERDEQLKKELNRRIGYAEDVEKIVSPERPSDKNGDLKLDSSIPPVDMTQAESPQEEAPVPENQQHRFRDISESVNSSPPLSVEIPSATQSGIDSVDMQSFERPLDTLPEPEVDRPGFFETALHTVKDMEMAAHAIDYAYHEGKRTQAEKGLENQNPLEDVKPPNWTPFEVKNFEGFSPNYFSYIADSHSPAQLQAKQQEVMRLMEEDDKYKDGSVWGKIAGFVTSVAIDYALLKAIPVATSAQYAKYSDSILQSIKSQAPGIIAGTTAYTAAIDATTTGKTMSDFAEDFLINNAMGLVLVGGAAGLGRGMTGGKMYEARHALKMNFQGIKATQIIGKNGELKGLRADFMPGEIQSAMHRTKAQEFLDSRMAKNGFFSIPAVGPALEKSIASLSPVFRYLNSSWGTIRSYANRTFDHSIEVEGVARGVAQPDNYEYMLNEYRSHSVEIKNRVEGYMAEANGFGGGAVDKLKNAAQAITKQQIFNNEEWGKAVMNARFSGERSEVSSINSLNDELDTHHAELLREYQRTHNLEEIDLPVKTAEAYLSRQYATGFMATETGEQVFHDTIMAYYTKGDALISEALAPIESLEASIAEVTENIHAGRDADANRFELSKLKKSLKKANDDLKQRIRDDMESNNKEGLQNLLEENILPTKEDEAFLANKLKPHKNALEDAKTLRGELSSVKSKLRNQRRKFETGARKGAPAKDYDAIRKTIDELEARESLLASDAEKAENIAKDEWVKLMDEVESGEIRRAMYYRDPESGAIKFKKPNQRPKFRPLYSRHGEDAIAHMKLDSEAHYAKIMGNDPDKLASSMMDTLSARVTGNPLSERSLLIPDQILLENNLLSTDIAKNVASYTMTLGRRIARAKSLKDFSVEGDGIRGVMIELDKEFKGKKDALRAAGMTQKELDKAFRKLNKSYKKAQNNLNDLEAVASGTYAKIDSANNIKHVFNALRSGAAATKLANLPILQIPDTSVAIFKNGVWRWMRDGIKPLLTSMNGIIKTEAGIKYRKTASAAGLALERSMNSKVDELWNMQTTQGQTVPARVSSAANWAAQKANTLSLSASIENMNQNLIANISQSSLIEHLYSYKNGTLKPRDLRALLQFGIDPAKEADTVLKAFESSPTSIKKKGGGFASDYWNWEDKEARVIMSKHIRKSVASTLIKKGMFDSPLVSNDPVMGVLFTFTGWYFSALSKFVVPALQRPFDAYMMQGTVMSAGLGALVDPLRSWARGEGFSMSDEEWFASAISSSPPLAPLYSILMRANSILDNSTLNKMKNDRYRKISILGGAGGAVFGMGEDYANIMRMVATGKYNKRDIKRFAHSIPLINQWYTHKMLDDFIESQTQGLPRNYR